MMATFSLSVKNVLFLTEDHERQCMLKLEGYKEMRRVYKIISYTTILEAILIIISR